MFVADYKINNFDNNFKILKKAEVILRLFTIRKITPFKIKNYRQ